MHTNPMKDTLVFELTRLNQGILSDLKEANKTIALLRIEQLHNKYHHIDLAQKLENDLVMLPMFEATTQVLPATEVDLATATEITFGKPLPSTLIEQKGIAALTYQNRVMAIVEKGQGSELVYRAVLTTGLED